MNMPKLFRDAFFEELERTGWSLRHACNVAGVSYEAFKKVKAGKTLSPNVDDAVRLANALGKTLDELLDDRTAIDRETVAALWRELSEAERDLLRAAARGRASQAHEAN